MSDRLLEKKNEFVNHFRSLKSFSHKCCDFTNGTQLVNANSRVEVELKYVNVTTQIFVCASEILLGTLLICCGFFLHLHKIRNIGLRFEKYFCRERHLYMNT